ncbi:hypothetical protein L218DRAFT_961386 [Marasmius fiardii PR-910]|nr:hypothetical protein L218DRAFT_961386 [Marasmius fiardii PR-910]
MSETTPTSTPTPTSTTTVDPVNAYGLSERRFTETYGEKAIRKCKENPFVPIGALATTAALIMSSTKLRRAAGPTNSAANMRRSKQFQFWLRARVAFQTLTILAVCGGVYVFGQQNIDENQKALEIHKEMVQTKAARERREFDERMKEAEVAQEQEEALKAARNLRMEGGKEKKGILGSGWWPSSSTTKPTTQETAKPEVVPEVKPGLAPSSVVPSSTDDQRS